MNTKTFSIIQVTLISLSISVVAFFVGSVVGAKSETDQNQVSADSTYQLLSDLRQFNDSLLNVMRTVADEQSKREIEQMKLNAVPAYKLSGVQSATLISAINKTGKIRISSDATHTLKVSYSGKIAPLAGSKTVFYYSGGSVAIFINDEFCGRITEMSIPALQPGSKAQMEEALATEVKEYIKKSPSVIANQIVACLK